MGGERGDAEEPRPDRDGGARGGRGESRGFHLPPCHTAECWRETLSDEGETTISRGIAIFFLFHLFIF